MIHAIRFQSRLISGRSATRFVVRSSCDRLFSSSPSPEKKNDDEQESILQKYSPQLTQAFIVGGVGITIYGLSSFMFDVTYGLMSMTPIQSGYYGFVGGFLSAGAGGSLLYYAKRHISVNSHSVLYKSISALNSSEDLRTVMGGYVSAGELAAFKHTRGAWVFNSWRPQWTPARLHMIYNIYSDGVEGVVSVEAIEKGLHSEIQFIGVDVNNDHDSRILVQGNAKGFEHHDAMKALVSFKSMKK